MHRRAFLTAFFLAGLTAAPANAAGKLRLTESLKTHLTALKVLKAEEGKRALFDGRPLIVTFFASW